MVERTTRHLESRREFLNLLGKGILRTSLVAGLNATAFVMQDRRVTKSREQHDQETAGQFEEDNSLKVKYFAQEIIDAGSRISSQTELADVVAILTGWLAGDVLGSYLLKNKSDLANRVVGSVGMTGGKVLDLISTYIAVKQTSDPRFTEYGLNHHLYEGNPFLPPNPSRRDLLLFASWQTPVSSLAGFATPFLGRGYLGASPFIASHNIKIAHLVITSMNLGDEVKAFIERGEDEGLIREFLGKIPVEEKNVEAGS